MTQKSSPSRGKRPPWIPAKHIDENIWKNAYLTPAQKQVQLLRLRLEDLERSRLTLPSDCKWPTAEAVKRFKDKQSRHVEPKTGGSTKALPNSTTSEFPFPVTKGPRLREPRQFPKFGELPYELRYMVWEMALNAPNFIEVQFCTDFRNTLLINYNDHSEALKSVCQESREIALSSTSSRLSKVHMALRFPPHLGRTNYREPWNSGSVHLSTRISFVPERDTIFLRSWDNRFDEFGNYLNVLQDQNFIRHLALPFSMQSPILSSNWGWIAFLDRMRKLETLTFMLGCEEKTRKAGRYVELRDAEEWFADGRKREVYYRHQEKFIDVARLPLELMAEDQSHRRRNDRVVKVRFVAWRRVA